MREVSKEVVETLLDGELTDHLGFKKHDQKAKATDNSRNGNRHKTIKSKFGEMEVFPAVEIARVRGASFKRTGHSISGILRMVGYLNQHGASHRPSVLGQAFG